MSLALMVFNQFFLIIFCLISTIAYLADMKWTDHGKYYSAPHRHWFVKGVLAGYAKSYANLTTIVVRNAGHEAPYYQPVAMLDLINRILDNKPFGS
jgi:carboxypeptidase C (cathepsin A)